MEDIRGMNLRKAWYLIAQFGRSASWTGLQLGALHVLVMVVAIFSSMFLV